MATWNGACALGLPRHGVIAEGAKPGLVAVEGKIEQRPVRVAPPKPQSAEEGR